MVVGGIYPGTLVSVMKVICYLESLFCYFLFVIYGIIYCLLFPSCYYYKEVDSKAVEREVNGAVQ
jgi:hypothetical protein